MVRITVLFFILFTCIQINVQSQDTLNCEKVFRYYDDLFSNNLIYIWETPPSLKKCSNKTIKNLKKEIKQSGLEPVIVSIIVDSLGNPKCFRFSQNLKIETKKEMVKKLKKIRFNPALQKGKGIESIYSLKL